jgi:transposase
MKYPSDISESEWQNISDYFIPKKHGRPCVHSRRHIFNAILYLNKTGCQWRMLPKDFPPWRAVHSRYEYWCKNGSFDKALAHLNKMNRMKKKQVV